MGKLTLIEKTINYIYMLSRKLIYWIAKKNVKKYGMSAETIITSNIEEEVKKLKNND